MEKTLVICPNCKKEFDIGIDAKKGLCPYCAVPLVYEDAIEGMVEEEVDIKEFEREVDELIKKRKIRRETTIADVEVIKKIEPIDYSHIERKVDEIDVDDVDEIKG
jgi:DNA-directed RNA polymerase subunit RPC12/RpoP